MDNKTRCVDCVAVNYGRDIAELANVVQKLTDELRALRRQLKLQGALYGATVAYNTTAIGKVFNEATGEYI